MNELRLYSNENDFEDMMTKKCFKKLRVIIYTNMMQLSFQRLNIETL